MRLAIAAAVISASIFSGIFLSAQTHEAHLMNVTYVPQLHAGYSPPAVANPTGINPFTR